MTPAVSGDLFEVRKKVRAHFEPPKTVLTWNDAKVVFDQLIMSSSILSKQVPQKLFQTTTNYLYMTLSSTGKLKRQNNDLLTPFLTCLLGEFNGEALMVANREYHGVSVNAVFQVDFLVRRKDKYICLVQAGKDDLDACLARTLFGCEAVMDVEDVEYVYGVVTNQQKWIFVKYSDDKIEKDQSEMHFAEDGMPTPESVAQITGKLYGMLL